MLVLARKEKEAIIFNLPDGSSMLIRLLRVEKSGVVKVGIEAPQSVNIVREEIADKPVRQVA